MPELTDDQRVTKYKACLEKQKLNPGSLISFVEGLFAADPQAIAQPFTDGVKNDGCDAF